MLNLTIAVPGSETSPGVEVTVIPGAKSDGVGGGLGREVRQTGPIGIGIERGRQQVMSFVLISEGDREQTVDALVALALRPEGTEAEAGHGGIDLGRVGKRWIDDDQADSPNLAALRILERQQAARETVKRMIPVELLEANGSISANNQAPVRSIEEAPVDPDARRAGSREGNRCEGARDLGHVVDHRSLLAEIMLPQEIKYGRPVGPVRGPGFGKTAPFHLDDDRSEQWLVVRLRPGQAPGITDTAVDAEQGISHDLAVNGGVIPRSGIRIGRVISAGRSLRPCSV